MTSDPVQNNEVIKCCIGGVHITLLIDSGSTANLISGVYWMNITKKGATIWNVSSPIEKALTAYASDRAIDAKYRFDTAILIRTATEIIAAFNVVDRGNIYILGKKTAD